MELSNLKAVPGTQHVEATIDKQRENWGLKPKFVLPVAPIKLLTNTWLETFFSARVCPQPGCWSTPSIAASCRQGYGNPQRPRSKEHRKEQLQEGFGKCATANP